MLKLNVLSARRVDAISSQKKTAVVRPAANDSISSALSEAHNPINITISRKQTYIVIGKDSSTIIKENES